MGVQPHVGILLGNDSSGKTTALYQLKLGETVQTIPTMGFNVEEVRRGAQGNFSLWDLGGCDQMRALVRHYFIPGRFILFFHNCTEVEGERLDSSLTYFRDVVTTMRGAGMTHVWVLLTKQDLVPDAERLAIVQRLREIFEAEIPQYKGKPAIQIIDIPGLSALNNQLLHAVLDQVKQTLEDKGRTPDRPPVTEINALATPKSGNDESVKEAEDAFGEQPSSDVFWHDFVSGEISTWGHYAHLRSGYFVLLQASAENRSIMDCADTFLEHLARLRALNPQRFRNTTHRTMTVFWLSMLQLATLKYQQDVGRSPSSRDDFADILLHNPQLMETGLWQKYYSKNLMFSQVARDKWCIPDLEPLPASFLDSARTAAAPSLETAHDPDRLIRFALMVVQTSMRSSVNRGAIIKHVLPALEQSTIQLRAQNFDIPPYSETQAYFWIQFVHSCLASVAPDVSQGMTLLSFKDRFGVMGQEWSRFYSQSAWESMDARRSFLPPDLGPLPNLVNAPSVERVGHQDDVASRQLTLNEAMAILVARALSTPPAG